MHSTSYKNLVVALVWGSALFSHATLQADTAYVANEASATISVIDTASKLVVSTIGLGSDPAIPGTPQPNGPYNGEADHHKAFYNGHADTHGLWLTADGKTLLATNRLSSTVVAIDTATNKVLGYKPVGREPHLASMRPGTNEAWVAIRGENYVEVLKIDPKLLASATVRRAERMPTLAVIGTVNGPSMVTFTSNGLYAFVVSGKESRVDKIDASRRRVIASQAVAAPFTPFGLVTPDNRELYLIHKGLGALTILRTSDLGVVVSALPIGARANHVFFVGRFAYITVGGAQPDATNPDPEGKVVVFDRFTYQVVREFTGQLFNGEPHGIWGTSDGKLLVGHERGNRVTLINTGNPNDANDDVVDGTVTGSASQLAFLKKPIDIVTKP